jgi:diacylglycerol kinase family enzyme
MYHYICDSFIEERRYRRRLAAVEHRLTELDIVGERERVTPIRTVEELMRLGLKRGAQTIVIVGNDYTFTRALNAGLAAGFDPRRVVLGIIPFGAPNQIAARLGLHGDDAVQELAARKIDLISLGRVNRRFFITAVEIGFEAEHKTRKELVEEKTNLFTAARRIKKYKPQKVRILIDDQFMISCPLFNLSVASFAVRLGFGGQPDQVSPHLGVNVVPCTPELNGRAALVARREYRKLPNASFFTARQVKVAGPKTVKIAADGVLYDTLPVEIEVIPEAVRVVVGKGRR